MLDIAKLMALSEASSGFVGGSIEDSTPEVSLTEATGMFPINVMGEQLALYECIQAQNEALVEATITAISEGTQFEAEALVEASFAEIKNKIKTTFERFIKWCGDIIAKVEKWISEQWDKVKNSKLVEKLKAMSPLEENKLKAKNLTYNGYDFSKVQFKFKDISKEAEDINGFIGSNVGGAVSPEQFALEVESTNFSEEAFDEKMKTLADTSPEQRKFNFIKALMDGSANLSPDNWEETVKSDLYGEKVDMAYGSGCFTKAWVLETFKFGAAAKLKNEYRALRKGIEKAKAAMEKAADAFNKNAGTANEVELDKSAQENPDVYDPEVKRHAHGTAVLSKYYTEYMKVFDDAVAAIGKVKDINVNYVKAENSQAISMALQMLKPGKKAEGEESKQEAPAAAAPAPAKA